MNLFQKWLGKIFGRPPRRNGSQRGSPSTGSLLSRQLTDNLSRIADTMGHSTDLIIREFKMGEILPRHAAVIYLEGLADTKTVLEPMVMILHEQARSEVEWPKIDPEDFLERLFVPVGSIKKETQLAPVMLAILSGAIVLLFDGEDYAVVADARKRKERGVEEPAAEPSVRGPRDGFTETLRTNTSLIRQRIKDPNLWMETMRLGRVTQTEVAFMYIKGIASEKVVEELRRRLQAIDADSMFASAFVEEFIQDKTLTVFPVIHTSERPDVICGALVEGRVAIFVDGSPFVLDVPAMFVQFMQASEDHYQRWVFASFIRAMRYASLFITLLAPALYVAMVTFHQELLPPELLMSLASAREGVPFPAFVEAMIMEITFEILREAGLRMPRTIGQAVTIVGTLVIGQAAVEAGLVSSAMVIVVSLTAISNFVIPHYGMAIAFRLLRFFMMLLAGSLGIFGILIGLFIMVLHLCSLHSFGVPYLTSFAPFRISDQKDTILRLPRWAMINRPSYVKGRNYIRTRGKEDPS